MSLRDKTINCSRLTYSEVRQFGVNSSKGSTVRNTCVTLTHITYNIDREVNDTMLNIDQCTVHGF